jgi:flagellar motor protein MotB
MKQRWNKPRQHAHHTDDWLMTYADLITLMLCFFTIFISMSIPKKDAMKKIDPLPPIVHNIVQPFKPPEVFQGNLPFQTVEEYTKNNQMLGNLPFHDSSTDESPAAVETKVQPDPSLKPADDTPVAAAAALAHEAPQTLPTTLPEIMDHMKAQAAPSADVKGDRISTIEMNSAAFFDSGSAVISASGKSILQAVAVTLKSDAYKDYQITIEGHTDDAPISTAQFPSNWELSTARAAAVVRYFLDQGVEAKKLRAAGYADTFPKAPNRDAKGIAIPQNQALNRRVVIRLEKIEKEQP